VYGESRNQPRLGQVGVASVIMNRANSPRWWGDNPRDVCLKYEQFSTWNANDPNRAIIMNVDVADPVFQGCSQIAADAISGKLIDPTGGADSYCVTGLVTAWNRNLTPCAVIGAHSFYKTV